MRKPNFFIIGAPKCGTTSLAHYLAENAKIFMAVPKEPHYFSVDIPNRPVDEISHYLSLFGGATDVHLAVGEASTSYLRSRAAVENILQMSPDAKFIVMLRNPVDMAYALHAELLASAQENEPDFERAWNLQATRKLGKSVPRMCRNPEVLQYRDVCSIGTQVERLLGQVPGANVHVILVDDFASDSLQTYRATLAFLGVPYDGRTEFPAYNTNKQPRSRLFLMAIETLRSLRIALAKRYGLRNGLGLLRLVESLNARAVRRFPLSPKFKAMLVAEFGDEIQKIASFTGRDLSDWMNVDSESSLSTRVYSVQTSGNPATENRA